MGVEGKSSKELLREIDRLSRRIASLEALELDRRDAEKKILETKAFYERLVGEAGDAILVLERDGSILKWNKGAERIFGWKSKEALGRSYLELQPEELRESIVKNVERVFAGETLRNVDRRRRRKDGTYFDALITASPVRNGEGRVIAAQAILKDITERRLAENALHESEEKYRMLMEHASDGIFLSDSSGNFVDVNSRGCEMLGFSREELLGFNIRDLVPAKDLKSEPLKLDHLMSGKAILTERRLRRKDGTLLPVEVSAKVTGDGTLQAIVRDITERKKAEESLSASERFLSNVFESIQDGISVLDNDYKIIRVNPTMERWYSHAMPLVGKRCYEAYHARGMPCQDCPTRKTLDSGEATFEVVPKIGPEGEVAGWLDLYAFPLRDSSTGQLNGVIEYVRDISERMRAEEAIEQTKDFYEQLVGEAGDAVVALDSGSRIITWNQGAEKIFGYSAHEVVGRHSRFLVPDDEVGRARSILKQVLSGSTVSNAVVKRIGKEGCIIHGLATYSPLRDIAGDTIGLCAIFKDITEQKHAEEALRKANEEVYRTKRYLAGMIENAIDAIVSTDRDGSVVLFNRGAEKLLGYRRTEVLGRNVAVLYENEERAREVMRQMRRGGGTVAGLETTLMAEDGSLVPVLISASILYDDKGNEAGTVGFNKDLRERKRTEEALRESEERYRSLAENSAVGIWHITTDGYTIYLNPGMCEILEVESIEELEGRTYHSFFTHESLSIMEREHTKRALGLASSYEVEIVGKRGGHHNVVVSGVPLFSPDGALHSMMGTFTDITERKRAEAELREAHGELQRAYAALECAQASAITSEKLAALGRLTAGVSHEILNPLNIITLRLHMMINESGAPKEYVEKFKVLEEQAQRITKITQALLSFARQKPPERLEIDVNEAVRRTLRLLEYDIVKDNIHVELDLAAELPKVLADQDQIQQVVLNLLTNARDAMPEGGRIALRTGLVRKDRRNFVEFKVEDTGVGIPPENVDKLFDPFFTTKPEGKGTGLGLAVCQGIVQAHGGTISAHSLQGQGTAFTIHLPLEGGA